LLPPSRVLALSTAVVVAVTGLAMGGPSAAAASDLSGPPAAGSVGEQGQARYLVRYRHGVDVAAQARNLRAHGVEVRRTFSHALRAAAVTTTPAKAAALARSRQVIAVEVDSPVHAAQTQSPAPWGLDRIDQRSLPLSTTYTAPNDGAGVDVYVVDTGVRRDHVDLGGRVAAGWSAIVDGRGSGDCNGHGTHVAGTIGGRTYGVAKAVRILPVRVLDCDGSGLMSGVMAGLDWVAAHHAAGSPAVVNLSLGGDASATVDAALDNLIDDGVVAAVAAGNATIDACTISPARVEAAITVAASDTSDRQATFSNHGPCVDLYAPGVGIASAWHTSPTATSTMQGTSMASPHAAGAAALLLSQDPASTPAEISARLVGGATTATVSSVSSGTPNRLLFVPASEATPSTEPTVTEPAVTEPAVTEPAATVPAAPTRVMAAPRRRAAAVTWVRGADGGSPLTGQAVLLYTGGVRVGRVPVSATATTVRVSGLRPGVKYRFAVVARNKVGRSPVSAKSNAVWPRR
jgi:subtilisin family serine protease